MDGSFLMPDALSQMLGFFLGCVVDFLSSPPGIYLWALILVFYIVGIFVRLVTIPVAGFYNNKILKLIHGRR